MRVLTYAELHRKSRQELYALLRHLLTMLPGIRMGSQAEANLKLSIHRVRMMLAQRNRRLAMRP